MQEAALEIMEQSNYAYVRFLDEIVGNEDGNGLPPLYRLSKGMEDAGFSKVDRPEFSSFGHGEA